MNATRTTPFVLLMLYAITTSPAVAQGDDLAAYLTPTEVPIRVLEATESFASLSHREKLYAHWMATASWLGSLITFEQVSAESPQILELVLRIFSKNPVTLRRELSRRGITDEELTWLRQYAARFLSNCGNYLSFGDTKFIPRIPMEKLAVAVETAAGLEAPPDERLLELFTSVRRKLYSLEPEERALGLGDQGTSSYYGEDVSEEEIGRVKAAMQSEGMEAWNTRLFKENGQLALKVASAEVGTRRLVTTGHALDLEYGDHAWILQSVVRALEMAYCYAANDNQRKMILGYIDHFNSGDVDDHKDASRWWVKDRGPAVETYIGFIETYRDPMHVRAEWEGLVAIVDREQSARFGALVDAAPKLIRLLPWDPAFEKDVYQKPDFSSLEVLAFANGGIPAGINIPNYDAIRMNDGFKNVSLGNVLRASPTTGERIELIEDADQELYKKYRSPAFKVQVGLHELLGHGSGKLLSQKKEGGFNFDRSLLNPLNGERVASWYRPGQTWGSQFGKIASSYEECRAEAVGLYLSPEEKVMAIFGYEGEEAADVDFINWLLMARAGVQALAYYDPATKNWGQAHMQARFALLQVMLGAGEDFLRVYQDAEGRWLIHLDRTKIRTVGRRAIGDFLKRLNIHKALADAAGGQALYAKVTSVGDRLLPLRDYVIAKRKPRHIWVQPVTDVDYRGEVVLRTYPGTCEGVIDSFLDRFSFLVEDR